MTTHGTSGFTLLELLLVVGIASVLIIAGITTYSMVSLESKIDGTMRLTYILVDKLHTMQQNNSSYGATDDSLVPLIVNSRSIPAKYISDSGQIVGPLSAVPVDITVGPAGRIRMYLTLPPAYIPKVAYQLYSKSAQEIFQIIACGVGYTVGQGAQPTMQALTSTCGASTQTIAGSAASQLLIRFN